MDERLRPTERLKLSSEYVSVLKGGLRFHSVCLRVHYRPNGRELSRLGLVVSRRVGDAVVRNRVKRLLREVFRRRKGLLPQPLDVVLGPQGEGRSLAEYAAAFGAFAAKASGASRSAPDSRRRPSDGR
jgi:ribonuclease P protein component